LAKGDVEVSGVPSPAFIGVDWELTNTVSPSAAGLPSEGYGQLSATAQPGVDDEFVIDRDVTVTFSKDDPDVDTNEPIPFGSVEGWVSGYSTYGLVADDLTPETRGPASITITPNLAILNVDRDVPAVVNVSLSEAFQTYVGLVTSSLPVSYEATNNPIVSFPGWSGNVWEYVSNLAAIKGVELTYTGNGLVVRDIQVDALEQEFMGDPSYQFTDGSAGQYVEVAYQDQTVITSIEANLVNYSENPSLEVSGTGWGAVTPGPLNPGIQSTTSSRGLIVAVGNNMMGYNPDGHLWFAGNGPSGDYRSVTSNTEVFVAVGVNVAAVSYDGVNWVAGSIPSGTYTCVIWDGLRFLAMGSGVSATSSDGVTWTSNTAPSFNVSDVTWDGSRYVAVGTGGSATSLDAITWSEASFSTFYTPFKVSWNGSLYASVGLYQPTGSVPSSLTMYSSDGLSWVFTTSSTGPRYRGLIWDGSKFIAAGQSGIINKGGIYVSNDGVSWVPAVETPIGVGGPISVVHNGTSIFAYEGDGYGYVSQTGYTWTRLSWDYSGYATVTRANNSSRAYVGSYSQQVQVQIPAGGVMPNANETLTTAFTTPSLDVTALAGKISTFGVFVRSTNTSGYFASSIANKRLIVRFYDSGSTLLNTVVGASGGGTGFATWTGTVPPTAETAEITVGVDFTARSGSPSNNSNATNTFLNADAQFAVAGSGGVYFDGSYPGATWNGTPGLSTSTMPNPNNTPLYDAFVDNNRILEVAAGEVQEFVLESNVWATSLIQPIPSLVAPVGVGNYHVIDSQGVPCTGAFVGLGGDVTVAINDLGQIVATLIGPSEEASINGGPYRLASFDGQTTRGEFRIAGTGIITDQKTVRVPTGADPTRFAEDVAYSITYPFVNTPAEAYTVGFATGAYASAAYPEVGFNFYTDGMPAWNYAAGKFFDYNGSRFRILSASVNPGSTGVSAQQRNTWDEVKSVHSGKTYGDLAAEWGSLRYRDNILKPRKEV